MVLTTVSFTTKLYLFKLGLPLFFFFLPFQEGNAQNVQIRQPRETESKLSGARKQTSLTCIWSSEGERSGYGETGSPSADMSHPLEWHSLCLGNLFLFPGHRMLLHWHLCPRLSQSLAQKDTQKDTESHNRECEQEKEGTGKNLLRRVRCRNRRAGRREGEKEGDINP